MLPELGQTVNDRYQILEKIAAGGMATVYLARDLFLERDIALKFPHPHLANQTVFVQRFLTEARTAAQLRDPYVVTVHDQGTWYTGDNDTPFLVLEYVPGPTLRAALTNCESFTLGTAFTLLEQVLRGLATAHDAGIMHRDVKPENVLLSHAIVADSPADSIHAKVTDFGLARAVSTATSGANPFGTVAYAAPEILTRGQSSPACDVYSAGIMFYELLRGEQPFTGPHSANVAYQHLNRPLPLLRAQAGWIPESIDRLLTRMAAKSPAERFPTARPALAALREVRAEIPDSLLHRRITSTADASAPASFAPAGPPPTVFPGTPITPAAPGSLAAPGSPATPTSATVPVSPPTTISPTTPITTAMPDVLDEAEAPGGVEAPSTATMPYTSSPPEAAPQVTLQAPGMATTPYTLSPPEAAPKRAPQALPQVAPHVASQTVPAPSFVPTPAPTPAAVWPNAADGTVSMPDSGGPAATRVITGSLPVPEAPSSLPVPEAQTGHPVSENQKNSRRGTGYADQSGTGYTNGLVRAGGATVGQRRGLWAMALSCLLLALAGIIFFVFVRPSAPFGVESSTVVVPEVAGLSLTDARVRIEKAGLVTSSFETPNGQKIGTVLETAPAAGSEIRAGETVRITVSSGPGQHK